MAAHLRSALGIEVQLAEGRYGEFTVHVDGREVIDAGALAFLGVLPSKRQVREAVAAALGKTPTS